MNREGMDALLVFGEHEDAGPASGAYDRWFTNGRPGMTVVFPRTGDPVALLPSGQYILDHLESSRRGEPVWIPPENLRASRDSGAIEQHQVSVRRFDRKRLLHPDVGELHLTCEVLLTPAEDLMVVTFFPTPGTDAHEKLDLLRVIGIQRFEPSGDL